MPASQHASSAWCFVCSRFVVESFFLSVEMWCRPSCRSTRRTLRRSRPSCSRGTAPAGRLTCRSSSKRRAWRTTSAHFAALACTVLVPAAQAADGAHGGRQVRTLLLSFSLLLARCCVPAAEAANGAHGGRQVRTLLLSFSLAVSLSLESLHNA